MLLERAALFSMRSIQSIVVLSMLFAQMLIGQEADNDSLQIVNLEEIILLSREGLNHQRQDKPMSSVDEYLEKSHRINMVKRGNYAWEPAMNNMNSDRLSVTIDGMRIFSACTDKMDPITSYVDISNLSEASIRSGQQGMEYGATLGGGIDLKLDRSEFGTETWDVGLDTGFESNGGARILSGEFNVSENKFFFNTDLMYRKSGNYYAGGDIEVENSQYEKYNLSTTFGYKINEEKALIGSFIFDEAKDIGYPALPMDVSLARGLIGSVAYEAKSLAQNIDNWETKIYVNSIEHIMDDSNRENVPIRMDMPGWSDTVGMYSKASSAFNTHSLQYNISAFYNRSRAEMTMYPSDPNEIPMYMVTWPDVRTLNAALYVEDKIRISEKGQLALGLRLSGQNERIADEFGLQSLRIFYPDMEESQTRFLLNSSVNYVWEASSSQFSVGGGYGHRAPTVSEAYGFFIYNSHDNHDYIGNPYLNNEKAIEINANYQYERSSFKGTFEASYFSMFDYVIGVIDPELSPMTIGSDGVKVYQALDHAEQLYTGLDLSYAFLKYFTVLAGASYSLGLDDEGDPLPFISPVEYRSSLLFKKAAINAAVEMQGALGANEYGEKYGESPTDPYTILNVSGGTSFYFGSQKLIVKAGVENLFDEFYSTFADWNGIPRKGRNIFANISYVIK